MFIKGLVDEDFVNYKVASMFIAFPYCTFKCEKECGIKCCQNSALAKAKMLEVSAYFLVDRYMKNPITHAVVCGGLEPFDSYQDLFEFISELRKVSSDTVVIYTGYKEDEVQQYVNELKQFTNIIVKFGRFVPDATSHFDELLGIILASDNQYAKKIS